MLHSNELLLLMAFVCTAATVEGCSSASPPLGAPDDPIVEGPVTEPESPFVAGTSGINLEDVGFRQVEFFISGTASSYLSVDPLSSDGSWDVEAADTAKFKTRALVYRPSNPDQFSGTVIVEWLNVSGGLDAAPDGCTPPSLCC